MSVVQRPSKEGGATTYQGKVTAGYKNILASEMDADLDTIYSAWNTGVDTVNIRDGSITGAKLASGAVGSRELADGGVATVDLADASVTTPKIADASVTDAKVVGVSWSKISGGVVQGGVIPISPRGSINAAPSIVEMHFNTTDTPGFDSSKASWIMRGDYTTDAFQVWRAPPPGTTWALMFAVTATGVTMPPGSVDRGELAVNAIIGNLSVGFPAASFILNGTNVWTTYVTLVPALVTRGGYVMLTGEGSLSANSSAAGGLVGARWLRDGVPIATRTQLISATAQVPLPGFNCTDTAAAAGTHTYAYQLLAQPNVIVYGSSNADGSFGAFELG